MAGPRLKTRNSGRALLQVRVSGTLSQRLVTDGLATDGEKLFCSDIFARISVLWRKMGPVALTSDDVLPIFGKLVEIHLQHPQIIEKFQQKLVYP